MMRKTSNQYIAAKTNEEDDIELNSGVMVLVDRKDTTAAVHVSSSSVSDEDGLTWTDDFFADRTDVVAVFDFNQDEYTRPKEELASRIYWIKLVILGFLFVRVFVVPEDQRFEVLLFLFGYVFGLAFCYCVFGFALCYEDKQKYEVGIPHLAVTTTGVRYVEPPEKDARFFGSTVLIPMEEIEAVEITPGARVVVIRTASTDFTDYVVHGCPRGLKTIYRNVVQLDICHLLEPYRFKKLVLSMKQQQEARLMPVDEMDAVAIASV